MDQDAKAAEALAAKRPTSSNFFETSNARRVIPEIPEHQLLKRIGGGSYGEVWLARNVIGTYHAVKIVYRNAFANERPFDREFEGIQNAMPISRSSPGLVHILQAGRNDEAGYFYYVMELADDAGEMKKEEGRMQNEASPPGDTSVSSFYIHPSYFPNEAVISEQVISKSEGKRTDALNTDLLITLLALSAAN